MEKTLEIQACYFFSYVLHGREFKSHMFYNEEKYESQKVSYYICI